MKYRKQIVFLLYLFIFAVIVLIWFLSRQNASDSDLLSSKLARFLIKAFPSLKKNHLNYDISVQDLNSILRQGAHFSLFLILAVFSTLLLQAKKIKKAWVISFFFVLLMAFLDEFHQYFVNGRASEWKDIFTDMAGASLGIALCYLIEFLRRK